ncbi:MULTISPECIES: aldo/keto reductase [Nocardioides]|uniref:Aryl-alcohol dehydrogenase-like predicted oxidoreductase n=1 Tax=Nocardioides soli TaxID=1036020 RepID=A0A7W4W0P9_9ACTN|nr:aldo/keto reductase [Nocardioides sp. LMS-CY]MBB3045013.1 aryl-alcohol dehydrogenase-like predicted oxidoreductase [Nocardioides soli]
MDLDTGLVLGTMYFGTRTDEATSFALLDRYVEAGGRVLDTANCYAFWSSPTGHGGQSEALLGRWLAANPGLRDELVIATKVGVEPLDGGGVEGLSAPVIEREAARSLERLGVEAIDLYWAHGEDRSTDLEETVAAFGSLVERGVVRRLGVSNHPTWRVERGRAIAHRLGVEPWTALQLTTSYVEPRPGAPVPGKDHRFGFVTDETVDYLDGHPEIELWVYSPLVQGSYDRADRPFPEAYDHPGTTERLAALTARAEELGVPRSRLVLAWMLERGWRPIVGVSTVEQLDSALAAASIR